MKRIIGLAVGVLMSLSAYAGLDDSVALDISTGDHYNDSGAAWFITASASDINKKKPFLELTLRSENEIISPNSRAHIQKPIGSYSDSMVVKVISVSRSYSDAPYYLEDPNRLNETKPCVAFVNRKSTTQTTIDYAGYCHTETQDGKTILVINDTTPSHSEKLLYLFQ